MMAGNFMAFIRTMVFSGIAQSLGIAMSLEVLSWMMDFVGAEIQNPATSRHFIAWENPINKEDYIWLIGRNCVQVDANINN